MMFTPSKLLADETKVLSKDRKAPLQYPSLLPVMNVGYPRLLTRGLEARKSIRSPGNASRMMFSVLRFVESHAGRSRMLSEGF
jgi:hypothetical protein